MITVVGTEAVDAEEAEAEAKAAAKETEADDAEEAEPLADFETAGIPRTLV